MKNSLQILKLFVFLPLLALSSGLKAEPVFLRLLDNLDEPRGYCVDLSGYAEQVNWDKPIQGHTCKHTIPHADQVVESSKLNANSARLYFLEYDVCVQANSLATGESLMVDHCTGGKDQAWLMSSSGQLSPAGNTQLCLTIGEERTKAGTPPNMAQYWLKKLKLETCDNVLSARQLWQIQAPKTYNPGPAAVKP